LIIFLHKYNPYFYSRGSHLHDNPNWVGCRIFTSEQDLSNYLYQTEEWASDQASDTAHFIFSEKGSIVASCT